MKRIFTLVFTIAFLFNPSVVRADNWWESDAYYRKTLYMLNDNWQSIWSKYANNGNVTVQVYVGDKRLDSFECAVYDKNGEQRECKSSLVDQGHGLGWCMLTIHGDRKEEMHFRVLYDNEDGTHTIGDARETFLYYVNCWDLIGRLDENGNIDPTSVLTLHLTEEPGVMARLADGSDYEFTPSTLTQDVKDKFPSTTSMQFYGVWSDSQLSFMQDAVAVANPNCLYYFPSYCTVPNGWKHSIQNGNALTDIELTDGEQPLFHPFHCPQAFSLNGHRATYTRQWTLADGYSGWTTITLPFKARVLASPSGEPSGTLSQIDAFSDLSPSLSEWARGRGYWLCRIYYANEQEGIVGSSKAVMSIIEENSPYLIAFPGSYFKGTYNGEDYSLDMTGATIVMENIGDEFPKTPLHLIGEWQQTERDDFTFQGTFRVRQGEPMWLLRPKVTKNGRDAFVKYEAGNISPFRAYLSSTLSDNMTKGSMLPLNMDLGGDTDGIVTTCHTTEKSNVEYLLTGARASALSKGIIVSNGRKELRR